MPMKKEMIENLRFISSHYGLKHQEVKLIEEMAELTQAIIKGDPKHILEEMADVCIMITQITMLRPESALLERCMEMKIARQIARIQRENESHD